MAEILWALTAESDLQEIEGFIAKDSVVHAVGFGDRLIELTEMSPGGDGGGRWFLAGVRALERSERLGQVSA
jgi:plasmid stabilization system protein ParE